MIYCITCNDIYTYLALFFIIIVYKIDNETRGYAYYDQHGTRIFSRHYDCLTSGISEV